MNNAWQNWWTHGGMTYTGQDRSTKKGRPENDAHGIDVGHAAKNLSHGAEPARGWDWLGTAWESHPDLDDAVMVWMRSLKANTSVGGEKTWDRHVGHEYTGECGRCFNVISRATGMQSLESPGCRDMPWKNLMNSRSALCCSWRGWVTSYCLFSSANHCNRHPWQYVCPHSLILCKCH